MSFAGTWSIVMKTPMGERKAELNLAQDGDALSGTMTADDTTHDIEDGVVENGHAKWKTNLTSPMPITLEFDVEDVDGNIGGTVKLGMFGSSEVTGTPV